MKTLSLLFWLFLTGCAATSGAMKTFEIQIPGNPTTGYEWNYVSENSAVILIERRYTPKSVPSGFVGAGGTYTFSFKAPKDFKGELEFSYKRAWESKALQTKRIPVGD